jgi:hypothetical protein
LRASTLLTDVALVCHNGVCAVYVQTAAVLALRRNMAVFNPVAALRHALVAPGRADPSQVARARTVALSVQRNRLRGAGLPAKLLDALPPARAHTPALLSMPGTASSQVKALAHAALGVQRGFPTVVGPLNGPAAVAAVALLQEVANAADAKRLVAWGSSVAALEAAPTTTPAVRVGALVLNITQAQWDRVSSLTPDAVDMERAVAAQQGRWAAVDPGLATVLTPVNVVVSGGTPAAGARPGPLSGIVQLPQHATAATTNGRHRGATRRVGKVERGRAALECGDFTTTEAANKARRLQLAGKLGRQSGLPSLDAAALGRALRAGAVVRSARALAAVAKELAPAFSGDAVRARLAAQVHVRALQLHMGGAAQRAFGWTRFQAIRDRHCAAADAWKRVVRGGDEQHGRNHISRRPVIALGDGLQLGVGKGTRGGKGRVQASMRQLAQTARSSLGWCVLGVAECWTSKAHPVCGGHASNPRARYLRAERGNDGTITHRMRTGKCFRALRCDACRASGNRDGWAAANIAGIAAAAVLRHPAYHALRYGPLWAACHTASWDTLVAKRGAEAVAAAVQE